MKTEKIVFKHPECTANHGYSPHALASEFKGNLEDMLYDLPYNSDTAPGQGADMKHYELREVELPDWMDAKSYIKNHDIADEIFYDVGKDISKEVFQKWIDIINKSGKQGYRAIVKLVKQETFRSTFRKSLRDQVDAWFANPNPDYPSPLSERQMECITREYPCRSKYPSWAMRGRAW